MENSIVELMHSEHERIANMLNNFEKQSQINTNFEELKAIFNKFEAEVRKHFGIEESSIFVLSGSIMDQDISNVFELMIQHGAFIELINQTKQNLENNSNIDLSQIKAILSMHSQFEDSVFYPKLDEKLNNDEKQALINRILDKSE